MSSSGHRAGLGGDEQALVGDDELHDVAEGVVEEAHRVADELRRRVDLVGDAGRELADRLELLPQPQVELQAVAVGLGALGGGDVEEQPLQQAPVAVRRDHRTGVADPHLLAAGLDAAILGGLGLAAVGRALDDRRDSGAVVGMHARQQAIEAAHPLRHGEADELLDLRSDVQRARRLAVLAQFDDVDRARDLLDQLAVARLRELEHAPALVQRIAEGGGQRAATGARSAGSASPPGRPGRRRRWQRQGPPGGCRRCPGRPAPRGAGRASAG